MHSSNKKRFIGGLIFLTFAVSANGFILNNLYGDLGVLSNITTNTFEDPTDQTSFILDELREGSSGSSPKEDGSPSPGEETPTEESPEEYGPPSPPPSTPPEKGSCTTREECEGSRSPEETREDLEWEVFQAQIELDEANEGIKDPANPTEAEQEKLDEALRNLTNAQSELEDFEEDLKAAKEAGVKPVDENGNLRPQEDIEGEIQTFKEARELGLDPNEFKDLNELRKEMSSRKNLLNCAGKATFIPGVGGSKGRAVCIKDPEFNLSISYCEYFRSIAETDLQNEYYCTDLLEGTFNGIIPQVKLSKEGASLSIMSSAKYPNDDKKPVDGRPQVVCIRGSVSSYDAIKNDEPFNTTLGFDPVCSTILTRGGFSSFEFYVKYFYELALNIGAILGVVAIVIAGILYTLTGIDESLKQTATKIIMSVISGLALLMILGLILRLLNPTFFN